MTNNPKIQALVACQHDYCAIEISYPLDMVRAYNNQPICQTCYEADESVARDSDGNPKTIWTDLPDISLSDLTD